MLIKSLIKRDRKRDPLEAWWPNRAEMSADKINEGFCTNTRKIIISLCIPKISLNPRHTRYIFQPSKVSFIGQTAISLSETFS